VTSAFLREPARAILLDIEGTITPLDFVHQVLFPYARSHIREFLEQRLSSPNVRADISALGQENVADTRAGLNPPPILHNDSPEGNLQSITAYVWWLMDRDCKYTVLKSLQGRIWEEGYRNGQLRSAVFDDVPGAFQRWQKQERAIAIFSSGSVLAQRLLFAHTIVGDLTLYLSSYFDTATGSKTDPRSYRAIAGILRQAPSQIVFISDVSAEVDAAASAGVQVLLCERAGNHPQPPNAHPRTCGFQDVLP
jgi:enolase-phosphatase E1